MRTFIDTTEAIKAIPQAREDMGRVKFHIEPAPLFTVKGLFVLAAYTLGHGTQHFVGYY